MVKNRVYCLEKYQLTNLEASFLNKKMDKTGFSSNAITRLFGN